MLELTLLQKTILAIVIILLIVFYLRRFWFYFWKMNKLMNQFDEVLETTKNTNEIIKDVQNRLERLEKKKTNES